MICSGGWCKGKEGGKSSISLLCQWSHSHWYHHQKPYNQHCVLHGSSENLDRDDQLKLLWPRDLAHPRDRSCRHSSVRTKKEKGTRTVDPKCFLEQIPRTNMYSRQSEDIYREFRRLGIGFCCQGSDEEF